MPDRPAPPLCLFCRRKPARRLPGLNGPDLARGLGAVVKFCSVRCAGRYGIYLLIQLEVRKARVRSVPKPWRWTDRPDSDPRGN